MLAVCFFAEAAREPIRSQSRHLAQSPGLRKQMGRSLDDRQMFFSFEIFINLPIQCDNYVVQTADDESCRCLHMGQNGPARRGGLSCVLSGT